MFQEEVLLRKKRDFLLEVLPFLPCNCRIEGQKHAYMQAEPTSAVPNKTPVAILSCILLRRLLASTQAKKASDWYVETLRSVWSEGEFWNDETSVSGTNVKRCAHAAASCDLFVKQRLPVHGDRLCHQSAPEAGWPCITVVHRIHVSVPPDIDNLDLGLWLLFVEAADSALSGSHGCSRYCKVFSTKEGGTSADQKLETFFPHRLMRYVGAIGSLCKSSGDNSITCIVRQKIKGKASYSMCTLVSERWGMAVSKTSLQKHALFEARCLVQDLLVMIRYRLLRICCTPTGPTVLQWHQSGPRCF